jgi:anhydro-N-acetylmuramic acid kinase
MVYNVIGVTSGNSLDGLDLVFAVLTEVRGKWTVEIRAAERKPYTMEWTEKLAGAVNLPARDYLLLHSEYGHYTGYAVKQFIADHQLDHQVHFISSHGHTTFHMPSQKMTAQLGEGASIAAVTELPVISDLRAMDVALGGKGAPLEPIAEQLLFPDYNYRLNLGGNATISAVVNGSFVAFDICPCNYILDAVAQTLGKTYDEDGKLAAGGVTDNALLESLNGLAYYAQTYPKTLASKFGTGTVLPMIQGQQLSTQGKLNTYTQHITKQIALSIAPLQDGSEQKLLLTGGGAFNSYLVACIREQLQPYNIEIIIANTQTITFRSALMTALLGALRWRQEPNALVSVTGAEKDSVGGALWAI